MNVSLLRARLPREARVLAVVKADGYGLGASQVAGAALAGGAHGLAVSTLEEAAALGDVLRGERLLVMGGLLPSDATRAAELGCAVTCSNAEVAKALQRAAMVAGGSPLPVHLKVDTGMGRFGCAPEKAVDLARLLMAAPNLRLAGTCSHFASSDTDPDFTHEQLRRFHAVLALLREKAIPPGVRHIANSAAVLRLPETALDAVRPGIALYGCEAAEMWPVLAVRSRVAHLHRAHPGDGVGYGRTWRATRETTVATVTIGYADGVMRSRAGRGWALVRGLRAPLIGGVSMDAVTLDVTGIPRVAVGDVVTLIGSDGEERIRVEEVAEWSGTISYEILTSLGERVLRQYGDYKKPPGG